MAKSPAKRRARAPPALDARSLPSAEQAWQFLGILVVAAIVIVAALKMSNWIAALYLPFCDSNGRSAERCISCPEHGICQYGQLECLTGFRRSGKYCVEDSLIEKSAEKLAERMKSYVCNISAHSMCNGEAAIWLSEDEILEAMKPVTSKLQGPTLWLVQEKAIAIASHRLDSKIHGVRVFCCPTNLIDGYKPAGCRFREWFSRNFIKLLLTIPVLSVSLSIAINFWRYKSRISRAENLYAQVCEALEAKAAAADDRIDNPGNERWIVASRLRDHLLTPSERRNRVLWLEVERLVQEDSRIEQHPRIVKGESRIVWEWQTEGAISSPNLRSRIASPPSSLRFDYFHQSSMGSGNPTSTVKQEQAF